VDSSPFPRPAGDPINGIDPLGDLVFPIPTPVPITKCCKLVIIVAVDCCPAIVIALPWLECTPGCDDPPPPQPPPSERKRVPTCQPADDDGGCQAHSDVISTHGPTPAECQIKANERNKRGGACYCRQERTGVWQLVCVRCTGGGNCRPGQRCKPHKVNTPGNYECICGQ